MQTTYKVHGHRAGHPGRSKSTVYQASSQDNAEALFRVDNPYWVVDHVEDSKAQTIEARILAVLEAHQPADYPTICTCGHYVPNMPAHQAAMIAAILAPRKLRARARV